MVAKAGVGLFHQEPDFGEDYPRLRQSRRSAHREGLALRGRAPSGTSGRGLSLDATLFYKSLFDLVSPTSTTTVENGVVTPLIYDNGGRGRVLGLELLLRRDFSDKLTGWIAYTLSRSQRLDSGSTATGGSSTSTRPTS